MYNHNKAQQSKNRVHISWDILYLRVTDYKNPLQLDEVDRYIPDSSDGWPNVGPTSGRQYRSWANVRITPIAAGPGCSAELGVVLFPMNCS